MTNKPIEKKEKTKEPKQETKNLLQEMTELAKRTQANFENYRKQTEKRIEDIRGMAAKDVILQVIPIIDNFELALKTAVEEKNEFVQGVELIYSQLITMLKDNGVEQIEKKEFDPYYHEALIKVESDFPENTIIEEFQKGFILHGQVIRHARVKISAGKKENSDKEGSKENKKQ